MTSATVNYWVEGLPSNMEAVQLEMDDGETYTSRKFEKVYAALLCMNTNTDAHVEVVTDGSQTVTLGSVGGSSETVSLLLFGTHMK